jgi:hypothetical protein
MTTAVTCQTELENSLKQPEYVSKKPLGFSSLKSRTRPCPSQLIIQMDLEIEI